MPHTQAGRAFTALIIETFQFRKEAPRYFRGVDMEEIKVPKVTRELIAQELIARSGR